MDGIYHTPNSKDEKGPALLNNMWLAVVSGKFKIKSCPKSVEVESFFLVEGVYVLSNY